MAALGLRFSMKHKGCGGNVRIGKVNAWVPVTNPITGHVKCTQTHLLVCDTCGEEITSEEQVDYVVTQQ